MIPRVETPARFDDEDGGNADVDDPAIWVHPQRPAISLVIGAEKNGGLSVYNLTGRELQVVSTPPSPAPNAPTGRFNNVDILYGFQLGDHSVDLAVTTDRGRDQLRFYVISPDGIGKHKTPLSDVTAANTPFVFSQNQDEVNEQKTAYGLAVWKDSQGAAYAFVSQRNRTRIAKVALFDAGNGHVSYNVLDSISLPKQFTLPDNTTWESCQDPDEEPQVEGMVVDGGRNVLYAGQEDIGIWRIGTDLSNPTLVDKVREYGVPWTFDVDEEECILHHENDPGFGGQHLSADVEGLTIYYGEGLSGYLLASSQGDNTFSVYERTGDNAYLGGFRVTDTPHGRIDGSQECDGAAVINVPLNSTFQAGLLVIQDGDNTPEVQDNDGETRDNTNFKFVKWGDIARTFNPPLLIDRHGWSPRP